MLISWAMITTIIIVIMATLTNHKYEKENSYQAPLQSKKDKGEEYQFNHKKAVLGELTQP